MDYKITTITQAISYQDESPIFGKSTVFVSIKDEAAGWFIELSDTEGNKLFLDYEQLKTAFETASNLMKQEPIDEENYDNKT